MKANIKCKGTRAFLWQWRRGLLWSYKPLLFSKN